MDPFGGSINRVVERVVPVAISSIDVNAVAARIDVDAVLDRIDIDKLLDRIDLDRLLRRVDVADLASRVDLDPLLAKADLDELVARIDVTALLDRLDLNRLLATIDATAVLARIDLDIVLAAVDIDALLARIDLDALVARLDANALAARLDVDALVQRVDVNALLDRVDVQALVERANLEALVRESSRSVSATALRSARSTVAAFDEAVAGVGERLLHRPEGWAPLAPVTLLDDAARDVDDGEVPRLATGPYAGGVSRLGAHIADDVGVVGSFALVSGMIGYVLGLVTNLHLDHQGPVSTVGLVVWSFLYMFGSLTLVGRTPGKALLGLRVVARDGTPITARRALVRTITYPLSFALLGLGLVGIVIGRERRALHDVLAETCVVRDDAPDGRRLPTRLDALRAERRSAASLSDDSDGPAPDADVPGWSRLTRHG